MTETTTHPTTGRIVWFELPAADTRRARTFYGELFGWTFQSDEGSDYHMSHDVGGAIFSDAEQHGPKVYFGVADIDPAIARVRDLGGTAGEKQEIPGVGWYAECTDTEGNPVGLYQDATRASDGEGAAG